MLEKKIIKNTLALLIISSIPPSHASNNDNSGTAFTVSLGAASSPKYSGSNEQTWEPHRNFISNRITFLSIQ